VIPKVSKIGDEKKKKHEKQLNEKGFPANANAVAQPTDYD